MKAAEKLRDGSKGEASSASAAGRVMKSGVLDKRGQEVCEGSVLVEANGYVEGRARFEGGAFRVRLYVVGNLEGATGWGTRPHGHALGDYLVWDRVRDHGATVKQGDSPLLDAILAKQRKPRGRARGRGKR